MGEGRVLSIDYGTKIIGLACSDAARLTVRPLPSVRFISRRHLMSRLRSEILENEVQELVIGIPFNMNGSSGRAVQNVDRFAELLLREFKLPLRRIDERLSTVEATDIWREMSPRQKRKYRTVDSLSAALILERYLREY
ncbi:MAG TPA: Holliday junction resolvase RuvX [Acidobacteriota bacterium]|nr:Holliday junction resolvase RuvX [Acidobacteriota bacterium]